MSKSKPITEKDAWLSDEEMEYFEQAYSELEPGTVPEKSKTTEEIEDEDTKKFFEYKDMWRWWGSLFLDEDLNLIESYMKQIGTRVGLRMFEKEKTMSDRVKEYVAVTDGWFSVTDLYRELQIVTPQDKSTVRVNIKRLYDVGFIEKHGSKNGVYRKPDYAVEEIDWLNSDDKPVKILLPLG